jgi:hypothetical protein
LRKNVDKDPMNQLDEKKTEPNHEEEAGFTWEDKKFIAAMTVVAVGFSLRTGEFPGCILASLRQILSAFLYGFGIVFLFIGMTKKTFKYNVTKVRIVRWAVALAAIFAFSELLHAAFLVFTGQMPLPKP